MLKTYFILALFTFNSLFALSVSLDKAEIVAENIFSSRNQNTTFVILETETIRYNNINLYYVFHLDPKGFIIVAADDRSVPILGYSFDNNFSSNNQPDHIKWFMDGFQNQIRETILNNDAQLFDIREKWDMYLNGQIPDVRDRSVSPLLSARFDQGTTWNAMCPYDSDGPSDHALVGCVAVSMAQVMYYWKYPEYGTGSNQYYHPSYGSISANFNTFYDYDNMNPNIGTEASQKLLFHAGVAVEMGYGPDGSGAWVVGGNPSAYHSMKNYFQFRNDMDYIYPYQYSDTQYRQLLQDELNNNRPIIYRGYGSDGGHAWNIDGYQGDEFHCNWGWGGYNNGYFPLSTLGGFPGDQAAIIKIQPEDLNIPNIVMNSFIVSETVGDGDAVANPGEVIDIVMEIENMIPWVDATGIELIIESQSDDIYILNDAIFLDELASGNTISTISSPFSIAVSDNADLGPHDLSVSVFAVGTGSEVFTDTFPIEINVTIEQAGFPYLNSAIIESSPAIIDIDDDGYMEQFFGDYDGLIHGIDSDGNPLPGFPIQLDDPDQIWGSIAADDLDNDGVIELIVSSKNKHVYVFDSTGEIEMDFTAEHYLMATPALGDIDGDGENEIIVSGFASSGDIYAINYDGTLVNGFPANINEKVLRGAALADFNGNGRVDIVVATESDDQVIIVYDNGDIEVIFERNSKFQSSPSVATVNGEKIIFVGCDDDHFYGINKHGEIIFDVETGDNIRSSAAFTNFNGNLIVFFGSYDGYLYAFDQNGIALDGWPLDIGGEINISPVVTDLDGDATPEILVGNTNGMIYAFNFDGSLVSPFPVSSTGGYSGTPTIADIDGDGDLEINVGTPVAMSSIDVKTVTSGMSGWDMDRGNLLRNGYFTGTSLAFVSGDMNQDGSLNVLDVVNLVNAILSEDQSFEELLYGDMNQDGTLNVLDIVNLVNAILD